MRDFYAGLPPPVVVGIEATGSMGWFLRLMEELGITCHVGHPAKIRAIETRRQKHDRRDAALLLELLTDDRFPSIWMPSAELADLRALLLHRDQWVRMRTRVKNALQGLALAHGIRRRRGIVESTMARRRWPRCRCRRMPADRRAQLQALHDHLTTHIDELDQQVGAQARGAAAGAPADDASRRRPGHRAGDRGVPRRSRRDSPMRKALASYVGMIPSEYSSGDRQRLGHLTKQGNPLLRFLWCEAAIHAVRRDAALGRFYRRKLQQKGLGKARVAVARKLGIRLWISAYAIRSTTTEFCRRAPSPATAR